MLADNRDLMQIKGGEKTGFPGSFSVKQYGS
jgi:hypothetical protein